MQSIENIQQDKLELEKTIFMKRVDSLYQALPSSVFANLVIASVLFSVLWSLVNNTLLIIWYAVIFTLNIGRFISYKLYLKNEKSFTDIVFWANTFYFLLVLTALSWSCVSIWLLPDNQSIYHYFPALILIGISAGSVISLSSSLKNIMTYLILILLPVFIVEISIGTFISNSVAGLTIILILFSLSGAKRINRTFIENVTLHYESTKYANNLVESRNTAIAANSAKSNFISMISHELRTPLNAILGFSQLLKMSEKPTLNEEQDEQLDGIVHSGKHLLSLIEELLDLSKIESHKLKVEVEDVSLTYVLVECISLLNPVAAEYNIKIINDVDINNLNLVRADTKRLKQVFINLISNAIKYNHENGTVSISMDTTSNNKIRVSVSDTGNGLTEEQTKGLFIPFQRYDNNREGIGLGLFITQNLIELMYGEIGIKSEIGKGSTFWFELSVAH